MVVSLGEDKTVVKVVKVVGVEVPVTVQTRQKVAVTAITDMVRTRGTVQPHSHALGSTSAQHALHEGQADLDKIILITTLCFPD